MEIDHSGRVQYLNPASQREFSDLKTRGRRHPFLAGWAGVVAEIEASDWQRSVEREVQIGEAFYLQTFSPVPNTDRIRVYALDRTERHQMEERLTHLASFPELNAHIVMEIDRNGQVQYLNPVSQAKFPDLKARGRRHPFLDGWARLVTHLDATGWRQPIEREIRVGDDFYLQTFYPVPNSDMIQIHALDRTDRHQLEKRLAHLASFPELNPHIVIEIDRSGQIQYLNPASEAKLPDLKTRGHRLAAADGTQG